MKITIVENAAYASEEEIEIRCEKQNERIANIRRLLEEYDNGIKGVNEGQMCDLKPSDIFYFEVVDNRTFAYLLTQVWQVQSSLENLEERLGSLGFFRISKSCMINLKKVDHFTSSIGSRITATMENGEEILISRHYAKLLREKMKAGKEKNHG